jgi:formate-nitrite transporter family protein
MLKRESKHMSGNQADHQQRGSKEHNSGDEDSKDNAGRAPKGKEVDFSESEQEDVDQHSKLRAVAIYEIVRQEGETELYRPASSLLWSGLAAGLSIGFSVYTQAALRSHLPDTSWRPLIECWGYSVGFLIVILGRQQLFTEITLTAVLPVLARPSRLGIFGIARLWFLVLVANVAGTAIFGAGIAFDVLHAPDIRAAALEIAREATAYSASESFLRAIGAGWLIATVVWLLPSADKSSFAVIALVTYLVALFHLAHVVAGSVEAFSLLFTGELGIQPALFSFFLPTLFGNIVGGSALFALISYAQIAEELREK